MTNPIICATPLPTRDAECPAPGHLPDAHQVAATICPMDERRLIDIAREAASGGLRLYTDGQRVIRPQRRAA